MTEALVRAKTLGGQPGEPGLQQPAIDPIMLLSSAAGPAIAKALVGMSEMAPQMMASQAGAIFPEGMPIQGLPKAAIKELEEILPSTQMAYKRNEALANWHSQMQDFPRVLQDKWALLKHAAGS